MGIATLNLTPELFIELCKACKKGDQPRRFIVKANPLPDDAEVVQVGFGRPGSEDLRLYISSQEWEDTTYVAGQEPPELPAVVFETIYD